MTRLIDADALIESIDTEIIVKIGIIIIVVGFFLMMLGFAVALFGIIIEDVVL